MSRLDYGVSIWGAANNTLVYKLFKLQKRAARLVLNADIDTRSSVMFKELGWMSVYQTCVFKRCILMYKIANNIAPAYLVNHFMVENAVRRCSLRSNNGVNFKLKAPHLEMYRRSLPYLGPSVWNDLPESVKAAPSLQCFKAMCKLYIIDNYSLIDITCA